MGAGDGGYGLLFTHFGDEKHRRADKEVERRCEQKGGETGGFFYGDDDAYDFMLMVTTFLMGGGGKRG